MVEFMKTGSLCWLSIKVRGIEKLGGRVELRSHVEEIIVEGGRAVGVKLRSGNIVRARKAVVSNASIWDTIRYNGGHVLYNGHDKVQCCGIWDTIRDHTYSTDQINNNPHEWCIPQTLKNRTPPSPDLLKRLS